MDKTLEWKVEEAARLWLLNKPAHGLTIGCDVRHFEEDVTDETVDGTPKVPTIAFPAIILRATRLKQLTPGYNVHALRLDTRLWVSADDLVQGKTPAQLYQTIGAAREQILLRDDLADQLTAAVDDFRCHAIQEFIGGGEKQVIERHWLHPLSIQLWAQPMDNE